MIARPDGQGGAAIEGDPEHPANFGRLCSKGSALGETLGLETRLLHPMLRWRGAARRWDAALDRVAEGIAASVAKHGPDSVAFYLSGQLLTEDYYVANKLMKGSSARQCRYELAAVHGLVRGRPQPRLRLRHGARMLRGPRRGGPAGAGRLQCGMVPSRAVPAHAGGAGKARRELVVIDPRGTATARRDIHLAVRPGIGRRAVRGLLVYLADTERRPGYVGDHTYGFGEALAPRPRYRARHRGGRRATGLTAETGAFYALVPARSAWSHATSQGVNQSAQGTDKVNAIINCHLATGRIGRPGMGPFSLTGQPNAMGGREVGGLANQLAAHMGFSPAEVDRVAPLLERAQHGVAGEGLKAVEMFEAIERGRDQGALGDGHQPGRQPAARRRDARRAGASWICLSSRRTWRRPTRRLWRACPAAGRRLGRKGRHGHEFRAAHLAPARLPAAAGRGEARLVGVSRWRGGSAMARRSPMHGRPRSSASTRALSAFENDGSARFRPLRARADSNERTTRWSRCSGRSARGEAAPSALFADGRFFTPDGRPGSSPSTAPRYRGLAATR